jgi:hypothetical protein
MEGRAQIELDRLKDEGVLEWLNQKD